MKIKSSILTGVAWIALVLSSSLPLAQELKPIELPKPQLDGGRALMQVLKERHTTREFSTEKLPAQVLSNLLWAAFGINRPEIGGRTAPSAMNWQEIDLYVATADGLFLYDAKANLLKPIVKEDVRALTGSQSFVKEAPVNLIYVSDLARTNRASSEDRDLYTGADAGFISQNVYLFCASEGLATVVRGSVDRPTLAKVMKLRPEQRIVLAQSVGKPKQ
ncbi:MAG: SagB/ThcOx family dehydrogenase [Acidobacteriia bacterium]|nr:SagB/ThcOx family dehydrogenase [Terriglobia bacterium]